MSVVSSHLNQSRREKYGAQYVAGERRRLFRSSKVLKDNQFLVNEVQPDSALLVGDAAVFNIAGDFCAIQAECTHKEGPLNEGNLDGSTVTCPWHGSQFNVCTGAVLQGPAIEPLKTYPVVVEGEIEGVETA